MGRGEGPLNDSPFRLSGGQQQLALPGPRARRRTRGAAPRRTHVGARPGDDRVDRGVAQDADPGADADRRDPQPRAGHAGLARHDVLLPRAADGARRDRRPLQPAVSTPTPSVTSPAGWDKRPAPHEPHGSTDDQCAICDQQSDGLQITQSNTQQSTPQKEKTCEHIDARGMAHAGSGRRHSAAAPRH